jgi:ribosomal protein S18 acetylase RimI-like enzyme
MTTKFETLNKQSTHEIPGLTFRRFRGEVDYPIMLETFKSSMEADNLDAADTLEDYINSFIHRPHFDHKKDILLINVDGQNIANGHCYWDKELDGNYRYSFWMNLRPEWRGQGIERILAKFLFDRLDEMSSQHPDDTQKFYQIYTAQTRQWQIDMLEGFSFKPIRYMFRMSRPCSKPIEPLPLPEGLEIRQPTPEQYRQVWEADVEAFRDHWGMSEPNEERYQAWQKESYFQPEMWKVAWDGNEIAGMVLNFIDHAENEAYDRKRGYTEDISTRRPWRKQGIATALLTQSIKMFQEMGMEDTALGVDAENPTGALRLYERVGYEEYRRWIVYRKYITKRTNSHGTKN